MDTKRFSARAPRRRGMSVVEVVVAVAVASAVMFGLFSVMMLSQRIVKTTFSEQIAIKGAKETIEDMNREIRMAMASSLVIRNAANNPATQGNVVEFARTGEPAGRRSITLNPGADASFYTPWDNALVFDPNTSQAGDEVELVRNISPLNSAGAFMRQNILTPLTVQMRIGDPQLRPGDPNAAQLTSAIMDEANARSGKNLQGVEINITISPRN